MDKEIIEYILLIMILATLLLIYCCYVINDERKKIKYYKETISYETNWDKYSDMIKVQKKIILKKKIQLSFLEVLVFIKSVIIWK